MKTDHPIKDYYIKGRRYLVGRVISIRPSLKLGYLKLVKFLSTHGIPQPLAPTVEQSEHIWRDQGTESSNIDPKTYTRYDDSVEKLFQDVIPLLNQKSQILEIGCGPGRNLDYLFRRGFRNLTGIEIGHKAIELFASTFPDTYNYSTIIEGNAVVEIKKLKDKSFDLVFTHGVLVNIPATHNSIFFDMCRICRGFILTLESEGSFTAFPRDFQKIFTKYGFIMVIYRWLVPSNKNGTLIIPESIISNHIFVNCTIRLFAPITEKSIIS